MKLNKTNLQKYAELKAQAAQIDEEMKKLNPLIKAEMEDNGLEEVESDWGVFSFKKMRTWVYPESVLKLEKDYKIAKKESEQKGTASYDESNVLMFKQKKEENE